MAVDFFVSYNHHDKGWAEWIAWQLSEARYTVKIQAWDFRPGASFTEEMDQATKEARRTIAVLSPDYLNARYTRPEWGAAFAQDPTGVERKLVPVRVRECVLSGLLAQIIYINLVGLPEDQARDILLSGLSPSGRPSTAPKFPAAQATSVGSPSSALLQGPAAAAVNRPTTFPAKTTPAIICAAPGDEDHVKVLRTHLSPAERNGTLRTWAANDLAPGMDQQAEIDEHFAEARLLVMLITAKFLASPECVNLLERAKQRTSDPMCRVIPILVSHAAIEETAFKGVVQLPRNHKPITRWDHKDEAWYEVTKELIAVARAMT